MSTPTADCVDHVIVERVLAGENPGRQLNHAEKVEVAARLAAQGRSVNAIAKALRARGTNARKLLTEANTAAETQVDACRHGHAYTEENTYWYGKERKCRQCRRIRQAESKRRARDARYFPTPNVELIDGVPVDAALPPGEWQRDAPCRTANLADFFADDGEAGIPARARTAARVYCAGCPVRSLCDADATTRRDYGLWGGRWRDRAPDRASYRITTLIGGGGQA